MIEQAQRPQMPGAVAGGASQMVRGPRQSKEASRSSLWRIGSTYSFLPPYCLLGVSVALTRLVKGKKREETRCRQCSQVLHPIQRDACPNCGSNLAETGIWPPGAPDPGGFLARSVWWTGLLALVAAFVCVSLADVYVHVSRYGVLFHDRTDSRITFGTVGLAEHRLHWPWEAKQSWDVGRLKPEHLRISVMSQEQAAQIYPKGPEWSPDFVILLDPKSLRPLERGAKRERAVTAEGLRKRLQKRMGEAPSPPATFPKAEDPSAAARG